MAVPSCTYYRNFSTDDTTNEDLLSLRFPDVSAFGWEKAGYSFSNWNTARDGSGTSVQAGEPNDDSHGDLFYAIWEETAPEPYLVTDAELTATADAIRAKTGDSASIEWEAGTGFADAVAAIPSGGGVSPTAHAIFSEIRSNIDSPILAEAGETVTLTVIDTTGLTVVTIVGVGTELTGSGTINVLSWTEGKKGWSSGATKTFVMPSSDVVIRFTS